MHLAARAVALAFAAFLGVNLALGAVSPVLDSTLLAFDLRPVPRSVSAPLLAAAAAVLAAFALRPGGSRASRWSAAAMSAALGAVCLANAIVYQRLLGSGSLAGGAPLALSWVLLAGAAVIAVCAAIPDRTTRRPWHLPLICAGGAALVPVFLLGQILTFGRTDYRRPAHAAVVFGARAYADGRPSLALHDRVRTAAELHHAGLAPLLIMSGGPGDGAVHETEAMRRLAVDLGVPADAIVLDPAGVSTQATVDNAARLLRDRGARRVLMVSHSYHLPRVKLTCQRAGLDAYTVPARESRRLARLPRFVVREIAALAYYYAKPVLG